MTNFNLEDLLRDIPLADILNNIGDAVSIQDKNLRVLFQNDLHKKLIGDHVGEICYKGFHNRDTACEGCPVLMAFQDGKRHSVIKSGRAGQQIYAEITASPIKNARGEIVAGIEIARDVTARLKAESDLRETKGMLEDIAQGVDEQILLLSKDYKILWANKAAMNDIDTLQDEIIGNYCFKITHSRDAICDSADSLCPIADFFETGGSKSAEHQHHDKNGNKFFVEVSAYPITDSSGDIVRFVHISKDITERKNQEKEREALIEKLQKALAELKTLRGIIPVCASCKKIRDGGSWEHMETYISRRSNAEFTHSICPDCAKKMYPNHTKK